MTDCRHHCSGVDLSTLPPDQAEIVRVFAAALRQVREQEVELLRLTTVYRLKRLRAGMRELNADLRTGCLSRDS
jgi:hypothetical protein